MILSIFLHLCFKSYSQLYASISVCVFFVVVLICFVMFSFCVAKMPQLGLKKKNILSSAGLSAIIAQHRLFGLYWQLTCKTDCFTLPKGCLLQCTDGELLTDSILLVHAWVTSGYHIRTSGNSLGWKMHDTRASVEAKLTCICLFCLKCDSLLLSGQEELVLQKE